MSGLRTPSLRLLDTTISTERATKTTTKGDTVTTFAENLTNIRASVQDGQSREAIQIGAERGEQTFDVYVAYGNDIVDSDRIVHSKGTFNIVGSRDMAGRGRCVHYICTLMKGVTSA